MYNNFLAIQKCISISIFGIASCNVLSILRNGFNDVYFDFRATVAQNTQEKQQIPLMDYVLNVVNILNFNGQFPKILFFIK